MKKIKILVIIFVCFILTGCKVEYNLELKGDTFYERGIVTFGNSNADTSMLTILKNKPLAVFNEDLEYNNDSDYVVPGVKYYDKKIDKNVIEVTYKHNIDDIIKSSLTNSCYNQVFKTVDEENKTITYATSTPMHCYSLHTDMEEVKFNLKLDRKPIDINSDYNQGNVYTWILKAEDTNRQIYFVIPDKPDIQIFNSVTISLGVVLIIVIVGLLYISFKHKKVNKF